MKATAHVYLPALLGSKVTQSLLSNVEKSQKPFVVVLSLEAL